MCATTTRPVARLPVGDARFSAAEAGPLQRAGPLLQHQRESGAPGLSRAGYDRHWRFGVTQTFQLTPTFAIVAQLQRDIVSSDLPLYAYTSNSVLIGAQIKF